MVYKNLGVQPQDEQFTANVLRTLGETVKEYIKFLIKQKCDFDEEEKIAVKIKTLKILQQVLENQDSSLDEILTATQEVITIYDIELNSANNDTKQIFYISEREFIAKLNDHLNELKSIERVEPGVEPIAEEGWRRTITNRVTQQCSIF